MRSAAVGRRPIACLRALSVLCASSVLLLAALPALAGEPRTRHEAAADAVLEAVAHEDEAALAARAAGRNPDAWMIAFTLCARGEIEVARRLAAAAPEARVGPLGAAVERWAGSPWDADGLETWRRAEQAYLHREQAAEAHHLFTALHADARGFLRSLCAQRLARTGRILGNGDVVERWREMHSVAAEIDWPEGVRWSAFELGDHHRRAREYEKALQLWSEEAEVESRQGDDVMAARTRMNLGILHAYLGSPRRAVESFEAALPALEASGDPALLLLLVNTAQLHLRTGEFDRALAVAERARAEAASDPATLARCDLLVGEIHLELDDPERAVSFLERAREGYEETQDAAGAAKALGDLALAQERMARYEVAREKLEQTRAHFLAASDPIQVARTEAGLARLYGRLGRAEAAEQHGRTAVRAAREHRDRKLEVEALIELGRAEALGPKPAASMETLRAGLAICVADGFASQEVAIRRDLATALIASGHAGEALAQARAGVEVLGRVYNGLADQEAARARESMAGLFDAGMRAAAAQENVDLFLYFLEGGRAGALLESLSGRSAIREGMVPPELRQAFDQAEMRLAIARKRRDEAREQGVLASIREATRSVEAARTAFGEIHDRLQREVKATAGLLFFPEPAKRPAIQAALGAHDALVAYALLETRAFALVLTPETARIVDLGARADVESALADARWDDVETEPPTTTALASRLAAKLDLPAATKRLLLSPDGLLYQVPLALLFDVDEVVNVPSASTWLLQSGASGPRGQGVLAVGDPDYGLRLARLKESGEEARRVGTTTLLREKATEAAVREALSDEHHWRAIHFACHATIDPPHPLHSALELATAGEDDGRLTVGELFGLRVDADLVTLSACGSGTGRYVRGEGLIGLTRALTLGGAPRVLCSLWRVDDLATRVLMTRFYELWNPADGGAGLPAAVALSRAQQHVRSQERWRHPAYWAAWTLWGVFD